MSAKKTKTCSITGCPGNLQLEGRHVFRFPKEHDRWLQWVQASGRLDLKEKGLEYSYRNCRLCSLHFEEKWFRINKRRILLHPDAIPTRFGEDLASCFKTIEIEMDAETEKDTITEDIQEQANSVIEKEKRNNIEEEIEMDTDNIEEEITMDVEIMKPSTSSIPVKTMISKATMTSKKKDSPTKKRLCKTIKKMRLKNKDLQQKLRRLRKKVEKSITTKESPYGEDKICHIIGGTVGKQNKS
ncbi:uncharacterized protein [Temnothorax longispinosus]|uniref:uncharacterized protein n=1 Tax=Temnothorax longispinosus TaxID=300112 RepID=UPI003A9A43B8